LNTRSFELTRLDTATFEHLVNSLATKVLGAGLTGFAPGSDGGRDGYFEGEANYPSSAERWSGVWYIQSKFHAPSLSADSQKWLQKQVKDEIQEFEKPDSKREIPRNWIIATNIDPSATPSTGTFDKVRELVADFDPELAKRTHIWGGKKILDLLLIHKEIANHYGGLITSGDVLAKLINSLSDKSADIETILRHLIAEQLVEQQHTKLEQAGSSSDTRPGLQALFTDLPYKFEKVRSPKVLLELSRSVAENHTPNASVLYGAEWQQWRRHVSRSRVCFIRGGPGNGKSTVTQFLCQIQRAALLATNEKMSVAPRVSELALDIRKCAENADYWPLAPRIPLHMELRLFAQWYGEQQPGSARGVLTYLADRLTRAIEQDVHVGTLKRAFTDQRWVFVFDGLDEVPTDVKDELASEISKFVDGTLFECRTDALVICTSRPQGYSGQFDELHPAIVDLDKLTPSEALVCADPILKIDRSNEDVALYRTTLKEAITSQSIREIMTTPLQTHIMAVVVRDGGRPPERRWQLFSNFFQVIKKREANRNLVDPKISRLLREGDKLIKSLHNRLGFELHYRAERSSGAQTSLTRSELGEIISETVHSLLDDDTDETIATLLEATTERLVLVNTPESGETVRFDIRPLQEFFAAEYIYESAIEDGFLDRLRSVASDPHWREVMHFLLSALVEQDRRSELAQAVNVMAGLDEGGPDIGRALSRRLCVGGIVVVRLLREGVLESDKRTREIFRKCLPSFLASTDARKLLGFAPPPHSARWLASVSLDTIAESHSSESIGALCILPVVVGDDTEQAMLAKSHVEKCSIDCLTVVLGSFSARTFRLNAKETTQPAWFIAALLHRLVSDDWMSLGASNLEKIYEVLGADSDVLEKAAKICGICPVVSENLTVFFDCSFDFKQETDLNGPLIGGLLQKVYLSPDDDTASILSNNELWQKYDEVGGVLQVCMLLRMAAKQRSPEIISRLEASIETGAGLLLLPRKFTSMFINKATDFIHIFDVNSMLLTTETYATHSFHLDDTNIDQVDWLKVFKELPDVAPHFVGDTPFDTAAESLKGWLRNSTNAAEYLKILSLNTSETQIHFGELGKLLEYCPSQVEALKTLVASGSPSLRINHFSGADTPFELQLPSDHNLLCHLVTHLTFGKDKDASNGRSSEDTMLENCREYVPDIDSLRSAWTNEKLENNTKTAIGCLLLIADFATPNGERQRELYDELLRIYDSTNSGWSLPCIFKILSPAIEERDIATVSFADDLLNTARRDLLARNSCASSIARWREASNAPVHKTRLSNIWSTE
jgi:hypothetical protein